MKKGDLGKSFRYSKGPLYSKRELEKAERYLAEMGLTQQEDNRALGVRIYTAPDGKGAATIYLDELGAPPSLSGTMMLSKPGSPAEATVVWEFVKQQSIARTRNPVLRGIRKALSL